MKRSNIYITAAIVVSIAVGMFVIFHRIPNYITEKGLTPTQPIFKSFTVHGHSYAFDTQKIEVKQGDGVKVTFISDDIGHNFCVDIYGCTPAVSGNQSAVLSFVADKSGTYAFYSNQNNDKSLGMQGQFLIDK